MPAADGRPLVDGLRHLAVCRRGAGAPAATNGRRSEPACDVTQVLGQTAARACSRSAQRSSTCSMPTDSRTRLSARPPTRSGGGGAAPAATRRRRGSSSAAHARGGAEPFRGCGVTGDVDGEHRAPPPGSAPARRPDDPPGAPQHGGVRARPLEADGQRAQPAQREVDLERPGDGAVQGAMPAQSLTEGLPALGVGDHGRPEHDVAVAREVLRHRVHDDVCAERERARQQRCRQRVVDDTRDRRGSRDRARRSRGR